MNTSMPRILTVWPRMYTPSYTSPPQTGYVFDNVSIGHSQVNQWISSALSITDSFIKEKTALAFKEPRQPVEITHKHLMAFFHDCASFSFSVVQAANAALASALNTDIFALWMSRSC